MCSVCMCVPVSTDPPELALQVVVNHPWVLIPNKGPLREQ